MTRHGRNAGHHGQRAADTHREPRNDATSGSSLMSRRAGPASASPRSATAKYCYVAAKKPGHREPTPILRLRWQGDPDNWAIGITRPAPASTPERTPRRLGGAEGTPNKGIDETFILYGPRIER